MLSSVYTVPTVSAARPRTILCIACGSLASTPGDPFDIISYLSCSSSGKYLHTMKEKHVRMDLSGLDVYAMHMLMNTSWDRSETVECTHF